MNIKRKSIIEYEQENLLDLSPMDFVKCDTIRDLEYEISRKFKSVFKYFPEEHRIISEKFEIPQEFIDEWKKIVDFIPNNVMTLRRKNRFLGLDDIKKDTHTGNELRHMGERYSWDTFDLGDYPRYWFKDDKHYRCYFKTYDCREYYNTTLLFAEQID